MFKELIANGNVGRERPELNGAYIGRFLGVKERQRPTFETRLSPEPELEDVFVFEFEIVDADLDLPVRVSKWVRKPKRLALLDLDAKERRHQYFLHSFVTGLASAAGGQCFIYNRAASSIVCSNQRRASSSDNDAGTIASASS